MEIYLDWAATSVPDPDICKKIYECSIEAYGNPSSAHTAGQKALEILEEARKRCAGALGTDKKEIIFTSGGTESNNILLLSFLRRPSRGTVIVSDIEHPAVLEPVSFLSENGYKIKYLRPDADGIIRRKTLEKALTEDTRLVSVMAVNNETGAIQPVGELSEAAKKYSESIGKKIHFHCDAVQGTGKTEINFADKNIDSFSISGHKFRGPKGTGILILKNSLLAVIRGGGQESGYRPGTENIPGIYGLSLALEKSLRNLNKNHAEAETVMNKIISSLKENHRYKIIPEERLSSPASYSPYILSISVPPVPGEVLARSLSIRNICVGTGSACSNRKKSQSRTLKSMQIPSDISFSRIRISIGYTTTAEEAGSFIAALDEESSKLLKAAGAGA